MANIQKTPPAIHAAGWYPDPSAPGTEKWWSGIAWTEHVRPAASIQSLTHTRTATSLSAHRVGPPSGAAFSGVSLGLGILGCLGAILPIIGIVFGSTAIGLGLVGRARAKRAGRGTRLPTWGILLGAVGGLLNLTMTVFFVMYLAA